MFCNVYNSAKQQQVVWLHIKMSKPLII